MSEKALTLQSIWKRHCTFRAEGAALRAEIDMLQAEVDMLWVKSILKVLGGKMTDQKYVERLLDNWEISTSPKRELMAADLINMRRAIREGAVATVESVIDAHYLNCPTQIGHAVVTMLKGISLTIRSAE